MFKSKAFWTFSTVTGAVSSCVVYDRYQAHILRRQYLAEASEYGRQPLPHHQSPRCLSIFLVAKDAASRKALRDTFKEFGLEILTKAGVDYRWVVEVDGEEAGRWWDEGAREANKPELMLDDTKKVIAVGDLNEHVLERNLNEKANVKISESSEPTEFLWQIIRSKSCSADWPQSADGFLAIDPFTYTSLQSKLQQLSNDEQPAPEAPVKKPKPAWFWSKKSPQTPKMLPAIIYPVPLYYIPCEYPQTLFARLNRFLFGQRHLTRTIGDSLLALIREQPTNIISKQQ